MAEYPQLQSAEVKSEQAEAMVSGYIREEESSLDYMTIPQGIVSVVLTFVMNAINNANSRQISNNDCQHIMKSVLVLRRNYMECSSKHPKRSMG